VTAITEADASALAAVLVFVATMVGMWLQNRKTRRETKEQSEAQRGDHAATAEMVREIRDDQREMKADLRDVKDEVRSHGDRLRSLEHWNVTQDETTAIVQSNARKLSAINKENKPHAS
jgi:hypothetical protein